MARVLLRPSPARSLFAAGAALLALYLFVLRELQAVPNALLLAFAGVVFAVLLDLAVAPIARFVPRAAAVVAVLALLLGALALLARLAVPELARQGALLAAQVPAVVDRAWEALRRSSLGRTLPERIDLAPLGSAAFGHVVPFVGGALALLAAVAMVVAIGAFVCVDPASDRRALASIVPERHRPALHRAIDRSTEVLRRWMAGTLLGGAIVGVLAALGLLAVGVRGWLALGALAFAGALVPYLGSFVVAIAIAAAGIADSPRKALLALAVYALTQVLLGSVISPLVNRRMTQAPPALLLVFQFIMAASFGVLGVLLAQPLLAVATVTLQAIEGPPRDAE